MAKAKQISGIDCAADAAAAIQRVASVRVGEMCALRERALEENELEGVHDMRVASRRLRSALRDFMPHLRKSRLTKSLKEIKGIADALGEVRDQDVAITALERLAGKAPTEVVPGIHQLIEIRRAKRLAGHEKLIPFLDDACLTQLRSNFIPALEAATGPARKKSAATARSAVTLTYREVARAAILERLKELEKLSGSLYHPLKVKPLHKMRIAAKRLRYALELFEKCWGRQLALFSRTTAELQSSLGDLHDCDVWIVEFGDDLSARNSESGSTVNSDRGVASIWLLDHFVKLRSKHLRRAIARWRHWELEDRSEQLRRIVQSDEERVAKRPSRITAPRAQHSPQRQR